MLNRLPPWFKQEIPEDIGFIRGRLKEYEGLNLDTVCKSARCPNINVCFSSRSVTFMILGPSCSRNCRFCAVEKKSLRPPNAAEPYNVALSVLRLKARYSVVTSVTRDDLPLGGATQFIRTAYSIKSLSLGTKIEFLIPDFSGSEEAFSLIAKAPVEVIAHNIETIKRLYPYVRPQADYKRSLEVLVKIKQSGFTGFLKSGIMLGFGESEEEVIKTILDLKESGCDILTFGQYLAPSDKHFPVKEFITPEKFEYYRKKALSIGFKSVCSAPLVRSSYKAADMYQEVIHNQRLTTKSICMT